MDSGIVHPKRKICQKCNKNKEKNQISHRQPPLQQNRDDLSNLDFFSKACIVSAIVLSYKKTMSNLPISKINQKNITFFNFLQERIKKDKISGQISSFEFLFLGWLFASQKSGFSGFQRKSASIPSLRFGTGFASPSNPCHGF